MAGSFQGVGQSQKGALVNLLKAKIHEDGPGFPKPGQRQCLAAGLRACGGDGPAHQRSDRVEGTAAGIVQQGAGDAAGNALVIIETGDPNRQAVKLGSQPFQFIRGELLFQLPDKQVGLRRQNGDVDLAAGATARAAGDVPGILLPLSFGLVRPLDDRGGRMAALEGMPFQGKQGPVGTGLA